MLRNLVKWTREWLVVEWCEWTHIRSHIRVPLLKQGTNEVIGEGLFCLKCIKQ